MNYHVHPSPKPITPYSLYTTEKLKKLSLIKHGVAIREKAIESESKYFEAVNKENLKKHLASHHAYLQEPEFKVKQKVYYNSKLVTITWKYKNGTWLVCDKSNPTRHESIIVLTSELTHYQPGQKVDPSKVSYVREVKWCNQYRCNFGSLISDKYCPTCGRTAPRIEQWQPAPEPEEQIPDGTEHPVTHEPLYWMRNPLHAQWLTDRSEGKVQAVRRVIDQEK